jgi:hypothetical protein
MPENPPHPFPDPLFTAGQGNLQHQTCEKGMIKHRHSLDRRLVAMGRDGLVKELQKFVPGHWQTPARKAHPGTGPLVHKHLSFYQRTLKPITALFSIC